MAPFREEGDKPPPYKPENFGRRFSRNARTPSLTSHRIVSYPIAFSWQLGNLAIWQPGVPSRLVARLPNCL